MSVKRNLKILEFYGASFLRPNEDRTELVYELNVKRKLLIMFVMALEIAKNLILVRLPMSHASRYFFCELLISITDLEQRFLNFILILAMSSYSVYLALLLRLDKRKMLTWIHFLELDKQSIYAAKHHLKRRSAKLLYRLLDYGVFLSKFALYFYLLVVYIYYLRSFFLSMEKGVSYQGLLLVFLPSAVVSVLCISLYYLLVTKTCTLFILHNIFLSMRLEKMSQDLRRLEPKKKSTFYFEHLMRFQKFLNDLEDSSIYFNYSLYR